MRLKVAKKCHFCEKELLKSEKIFSHCFECNSQRLEEITLDFDPCPICHKRRTVK